MGMDRVVQALDYFHSILGSNDSTPRNTKPGAAGANDSSRDLLLPMSDRSSRSMGSGKGSEDGGADDPSGKKEKVRRELAAWFDKLNYTQKAKIHLARAFIMNPEVMVMLRPLYHFDEPVGRQMLTLIKQ